MPFGIPIGDIVTSATSAAPADGTVGGTDLAACSGLNDSSDDRADFDNDGDVDTADQDVLNNNWCATLGWGTLSHHHNRLGYAFSTFALDPPVERAVKLSIRWNRETTYG